MAEKTALLSVYNKTGIVEFAQGLLDLGWPIMASGGTAKTLTQAGVPVRDITEIVGKPILGHRVVTLSREIHAAILARESPEDEAELQRLGIPRIGLVCVDMYPLQAEIARPGSTRESVIEQTDIGGPTLLHSAAKGGCIVICDPADREPTLKWLIAGCPEKQAFTDRLAAKAEAAVANYSLASAGYRGQGQYTGFVGGLTQRCFYGENPWQKPAALYHNLTDSGDPLALRRFQLTAGKAPSYNNWCDIDRLLHTVTHIAAAFEVNFGKVPHIAVGVKHGNACGAPIGDEVLSVVAGMVAGDPRAIFGGVVMVNFPVGAQVAETLLAASTTTDTKRILDCVVGPSFEPKAIELLQRKNGKCRLITNPALANLTAQSLNTEPIQRPVRGGCLEQPNYTFILNLTSPLIARFGSLNERDEENLLLAWAIGSTSNSNTITLVKNGLLIGNGVGQQDRVGACELAIKRARDAGHDPRGAVAYSDSFFPFPDAPMKLAEAGIKAILTSSGSVNDQQTRDVCEKHGITLVMVPDEVGRGFFGG